MKKQQSRSRGRPPKGDAPMLVPITIRLPLQLNAEIEKIVDQQSLAGADKSTVIRELLAEAVMMRLAAPKRR